LVTTGHVDAQAAGLVADRVVGDDGMQLAGALVRLLDDDQRRAAQVQHNLTALRAGDAHRNTAWHLANLASLARSPNHGLS
jgi:hypothetical protein